MVKNLREGSRSYYSEAQVYDAFSRAEDYPKKILRFLKPKIRDKNVLDLGCGNGKYAFLLSQFSKKYIGIDISKEQIINAKKKNKNHKNTKFICSSAEKIKVSSKSIDIVISTWVLGTINGWSRKDKSLREAERVLKNNGVIFLIEKDVGGEFERIRGRFPNTNRTKQYNTWLVEKGFEIEKKIKTYFKFKSLEEARKIISSIWGEKMGRLVKSNKIEHKVIIFRKFKIE
jgi:ubiquinone/menaquinone biosynthesis C-methylase UbiE